MRGAGVVIPNFSTIVPHPLLRGTRVDLSLSMSFHPKQRSPTRENPVRADVKRLKDVTGFANPAYF
jgi:hypothetical protein